MARNWPRDQQRRYREERRKQAARVADRLMGKKKSPIFGESRIRSPFQYQDSTNFYNNTVRPSLVPWELGNEVK
jgi:hypothetical protein